MLPLLLILNLVPVPAASPAWSCPQLERSVQALGGRPALERLPPLLWAGRGQEFRTAEAQGPAPGRMVPAGHEERLAVDRSTLRAAYWLRTGRHDGSVRERTMRPPGGDPRTALQFARRIPHLLLLEMADHPTAVQCLADTLVGTAQRMRMTFDPPGEDQRLELWLDPRSADLLEVHYPLELPGAGMVVVAFGYRGWAPHPLLGRAPAGHQTRVGERVLLEVTYSALDTGAVAVAAMLPSPAAPATAAQAPFAPSWETVSPWTHLATVGPGLTAMVTELGGALVVVEAPAQHPLLIGIPSSDAPGSNAASETLLELIGRQLPGRAIRALVVTHLHSDHAGGVRPFVAAGVPVIGPRGTASFIEAIVRTPLRRGTDALARAPRAAQVTEVGDSLVLEEGGRRLVLYEVGSNPHTDAMLFAHLPGEALGFQGDLFYPEPDRAAITPGREPVSRFFARWLHDHGVRIERLYGVHGGVAGAAHLQVARGSGG